MNFTILSLQLSLYGSPGAFFSRSVESLSMKSSFFTKAYSPLFHFSRFGKIDFVSTAFTNSLARPVTIENQDYRKMNFNETSNFSDTSVSFDRCLFINLSNPDGPGGAIYAISKEEGCSVRVNNSGFSNCYALEGGAIYVSRINDLALEHVCFSDCEAETGESSAFYGNTGESVQMSWVSVCGGSSDLVNSSRAIYIKSVKSYSKFLNVSDTAHAMTLYANAFFCEMLYTHINKVNAVTHMHMRHMANMVKYYDVVNCSMEDPNSSLFTLNGTKLSLFYGMFVNVKVAKCVVFGSEAGTTCRFQDCTFNGCMMEQDWSQITQRRVNYDVENATLYSPVMMNTDYCWYGQATWDVQSIAFQLSGASIAFLVICGCVFVLYCFMKGRLADPGNITKESEMRRRSSDWSGRDDELEELGIDEDLEQPDQNEPMAAITDAVATESKDEKPKEKTYQ